MRNVFLIKKKGYIFMWKRYTFYCEKGIHFFCEKGIHFFVKRYTFFCEKDIYFFAKKVYIFLQKRYTFFCFGRSNIFNSGSTLLLPALWKLGKIFWHSKKIFFSRHFFFCLNSKKLFFWRMKNFSKSFLNFFSKRSVL